MQIDGLTPQPLRQATEATPERQREEAKLKDACTQFEQMYLQQMFKEMRKCSSMGKEGGEGQQQEMFQGMLDDERAKHWSQQGGVGLAKLLFEQMKTTL